MSTGAILRATLAMRSLTASMATEEPAINSNADAAVELAATLATALALVVAASDPRLSLSADATAVRNCFESTGFVQVVKGASFQGLDGIFG